MKIFKKLLKKKIIITIIIVLIVVFIGYRVFIKNGEPEYILEEVTYGNVVKEVSETGMVKVAEQANLSFKSSGRIDEIYVAVGDIVTAGQKLAKLDTNQLYIELTEAQAALSVTKADYNKLLAGSSEEEVKVAETEVYNTQVSLDNAEQSLVDVKINAQQDLNNTYEDALSVLNDAYLKIYNALSVVKNIRDAYFSSNDQEGAKVRTSINKIQNLLNALEVFIDEAQENSDHDKIDTALTQARNSTADTKEELENVRNATESESYKNDINNADKTLLDNHKSYINTAYAGVISAQQDISTTTVDNDTNINTAEASVSSAKAALQKTQDQLELKKAGPTQEDMNLYLAKIEQAQAKVSLLQNNVNEAVLKSPDNGQITAVNKRRGETISSADFVIGFLLSGPFQIEVDVYEEDIVDVQVDNYVAISLPAFPDDMFKGKVISIDPAEKLVGGVVYYEVNISFEIQDQNIKPGMTADVVIETNKRENVLVIPAEAIEKRDGVKMAKVYEGKALKYREISIGLEGEDYTEILSGLTEGEIVIVGKKQQ